MDYFLGQIEKYGKFLVETFKLTWATMSFEEKFQATFYFVMIGGGGTFVLTSFAVALWNGPEGDMINHSVLFLEDRYPEDYEGKAFVKRVGGCLLIGALLGSCYAVGSILLDKCTTTLFSGMCAAASTGFLGTVSAVEVSGVSEVLVGVDTILGISIIGAAGGACTYGLLVGVAWPVLKTIYNVVKYS